MKGFLLTLLYHLILQYLFTIVVCLVIFSETNRLDQTLCFQLWEKGFFKDNLLGSAWIPLMQIHHSNEGGSGAWVQLSNETPKGLVSSGHLILVDSRFELPTGKKSSDSLENVVSMDTKITCMRLSKSW